MHISLNAKVDCTDGHAGQTTCVIINPVTRQLTHIIVAEKGSTHMKRLVPLELIAAGHPHDLRLNCTTAQLATLRPFMEIEYPRAGALYFTYESDKVRSWPYETAIEMPVPAELERILPEEYALHQHSLVETTAGRIGKVNGFLVNPGNKNLFAIIIETGFFWNKHELVVAVAHIDHFANDLIALKLDKHQLKNLAHVQVQDPYTYI